MDQQAFLQPLVPYLEAFAEPDSARRIDLLGRAMTPDAQIWGPKRVFAGYREISEKIEGFHKNWPGCRLVITTGPNTFLNAARFGSAIVGPDGEVRASGETVMELSHDGRYQRVLPFWEALPPLPTGWPEHFAPKQGEPSPASVTASARGEALARHLRELEESLLQPDVRKSQRLVDLLADEFIEFGSSGRTYTKADLVATLQAESPSTQTTNDFKVTELSPQVALLTYRIHNHREPPVYTLRSSVWQQSGGQWRMVFHQATLTQ